MKSHDTWHDVSPPPPFFSTSVLASSNKVRNRHYLLIGDMAFFNRVKASKENFIIFIMSLIIIFPHFYNSVANHGAVTVLTQRL